MDASHKTTCWMSPMIRGTDAQRAELKRTIEAALRTWSGNLTRTAAALCVGVETLRRYVDRLGLGSLVAQQRRTGRAQVARSLMMSAVGQLGGRPRKPPPP